MKCPKCGYLGFETIDRCRNCGYDFSLSMANEPSAELPLQRAETATVGLVDFDLATAPASDRSSASLDLNRVIGSDRVNAPPPVPIVTVSSSSARSGQEPLTRDEAAAVAGRFRTSRSAPAMPLFTRGDEGDDVPPVVAPPRPAGPPLSRRRATPDVPRLRPRVTAQRREEPELDLDAELDRTIEAPSHRYEPLAERDVVAVLRAEPARIGRLIAATIDLLILGGINAAVIYLTLAIAGLTTADLAALPVVPLVAFLLLLNGGYLIGFTSAGGQTIGKMICGVRVTTDDGGRVDVAKAVVRAAGCLICAVTLGIGYLPVFAADSRAVQDRLAGTRVIRAR